jgi:cytochrome oxidase Cu insertion factor (SCO1/SenC/PrrC family)
MRQAATLRRAGTDAYGEGIRRGRRVAARPPGTIVGVLKPADQAPDFTLPDQHGNPITLSDLRGKKVVLYFYPKSDT